MARLVLVALAKGDAGVRTVSCGQGAWIESQTASSIVTWVRFAVSQRGVHPSGPGTRMPLQLRALVETDRQAYGFAGCYSPLGRGIGISRILRPSPSRLKLAQGRSIEAGVLIVTDQSSIP